MSWVRNPFVATRSPLRVSGCAGYTRAMLLIVRENASGDVSGVRAANTPPLSTTTLPVACEEALV